MKTFLKTAEAKSAKTQLRAGVDFMQSHGLKRLPVENFVLVRENGHINVIKENVQRQVTRRVALGFTSVKMEKKTAHCGKFILE